MVRHAVAVDASQAHLDSDLVAQPRHALGKVVTPKARVDDHLSGLGNPIFRAVEDEGAVAHDLAMRCLRHDGAKEAGPKHPTNMTLLVERRIWVGVAIAAINASDETDHVSPLHLTDHDVILEALWHDQSVVVEQFVTDGSLKPPSDAHLTGCPVPPRSEVALVETIDEAE